MRLLLIDNYDSFTYNLAHLFGELGAEVVVMRNDEIGIDEARGLAPSHLVISPGPGRPEQAGISEDAVRAFAALKTETGEQAGAPGQPLRMTQQVEQQTDGQRLVLGDRLGRFLLQHRSKGEANRRTKRSNDRRAVVHRWSQGTWVMAY